MKNICDTKTDLYLTAAFQNSQNLRTSFGLSCYSPKSTSSKFHLYTVYIYLYVYIYIIWHWGNLTNLYLYHILQ